MNAITLKNITKSFGDFKANDSISFEVQKGEVHAILGENGAGKSTLMKIIYGEHKPDSGGEIFLNGTRQIIKSPHHAITLGIGMVHQHFRLIQPFTILQNIILGFEPRNFLGFIDYKKAKEKVSALLELYQFNLNLDEVIEESSVGTQQRVEIVKTLYRKSEILIFDEPTAVLTPQEIDEFYKIVFNLKKEGKTILIITHKLQEIKTIADRCTIIRKGKYIETLDVQSTSKEELASKMVGSHVELVASKEALKGPHEVCFEVKDLVVKNNKNQNALNKFNLQLKKGVITGIAGIDGNGQSELVEAITGLRKVTSGNVFINTKDITNQLPKNIYQSGISSIPEDRQKVGLVMDFSVEDNLILHKFDQKPYAHYGVIINREITKFADSMIDRFGIRTTGPGALAKNLSGGNQQKIILAREISNNPDVLIAFQPTRGLDVGAISYIHKELIKLRNEGKAVLLISYELDEIINLSDEIDVIYKGAIAKELNLNEINSLTAANRLKEELGLYMSGAKSSMQKMEKAHE